MKYLKEFRLFENFPISGGDNLTGRQLQSIMYWTRVFGIKEYSINDDGLIDVNETVFIEDTDYVYLPLKFNKIYGDFYCSGNKLVSLKGSPKWISGCFECSDNQLKTLEGGPTYVGDDYYCNHNDLTDLKGCPRNISGSLLCSYNELETLDGAPNSVGDVFDFSNNEIYNIDKLPSCNKISLGNNPIYEIYNLFLKDKEKFMKSLDHNYFLGGNEIDSLLLEDALEEIGREIPVEIKGYKLV